MNKSEVQITTVSPKGQVVIPQEIRKKLNIKPGTKYAVYGRDDTIIFKRIEVPGIEVFERLVDWGTEFARKKGISEDDVLKDD